MRWIVVGIGVAAVAVLLFWMRDDGEARRSERDEVETSRSSVAPGELGEKEREEEGKRVTLLGLVVNEEDQPIAGAKLEVVREKGVERETATSGADGRFRLEAAPRPYLAVQVRHADYVTGVAYFNADAFDAERRIVLTRGAKYGLRVVGPDREPIPDAVVSAAVHEQRGVIGFWDWSNERELEGGRTDVDGMLAIGTLPLGSVKLKVEHPGYAVHREVLEVISEEAVEHLVVLNRGGSIEGRVLGPADEPIVNARVFTDDREARSDDAGRYRIERVGTGPATVRAEKEGLAPGFFGARIGWDDPVPIQVVAGETIPEVDVYLGAASWIVGRIVDEKGAPIEGAFVSMPVWGAFALDDDFKSDAEGRFVAGPYHVTEPSPTHCYIRKSGFIILRPPTRALKTGERLDLGDLEMTTSPPIVGRVVDGDGKGVAGATVTSQPGWNSIVTDAEGRFEMAVEWAVKLTVSAAGPPGKPGRCRPTVVDARAGKPRSELVLTLIEPLSIRGTVFDGKGHPRVGVTLIARSTASGQAAPDWGFTDEEGRFEVKNLVPGRYKIGVVGPSGNYYWDDVPYVKDPAPREVDAGEDGVDFRFPYTGGVVIAKVVSKRTGRPIRKIRYGLIRYRLLIPQFATSGEIENREGKVRLEFGQQGSFAVEFQADGHASYRTPRMSLKKGETKNLGTIRLGEGATLVGIVKDAHGLPVPYTRINILSPKFETNDNEPFTGRDGRFKIPSISPGLYNVFAISPRHPIGFVRNINLREGQTNEVEVRFVRPAPLEILVRDPGGSPIQGARLSFTFPAIAPLSSKLFRSKIPPGYGSHISDAEGRIFQHSLPAGPVTLSVEAQGFTAVTKQLRLPAGEKTRMEFTLSPKK